MAHRQPDEARALAAGAAAQPAASVYAALREIDERLHLRAAQEACAGVASLDARRQRRERRNAPAASPA